MKIPDRAWWPWSVRLAVAALLTVLWWSTAMNDADWALWRRYSEPVAVFNIACSALLLAAGYVLVSPQAARLRSFSVCLAGMSVVLAFALFETPTVLGHDYGRTFGTRQNDTWLQLAMGVNRRDADLLHVHQPHTHYQGAVTGNLAWLGIPAPRLYKVDVAYDRNGFRNDEDYTQADVVAIGDSFVEGAETPRDLTAVAEMSRLLGVRVANLGQSSYGPQQELVVLERYGVPLSPRAVVWFFFGGNDLSDVDAYEWGRSHLGELLALRSLGSRSFTHNALLAIAHLTTPARREPSTTARRHAARFRRADGNTEVIYLDAPEAPWQPRQWSVASATLAAARDASRRVNADFLVVYIPRKLRVYQGFLQAEPGAFAQNWQMNNLPAVMAGWCNDNGIAFLDSTVPLRAAAAAGESVYLPDDVHWNPAGHRIVAAAVSRRLREMGSLASGMSRVIK